MRYQVQSWILIISTYQWQSTVTVLTLKKSKVKEKKKKKIELQFAGVSIDRILAYSNPYNATGISNAQTVRIFC